MFELFSMENIIALLTLTVLEVVLGIDNIVVIAIVTGKLPHHQQAKTRSIGLLLAMVMRILLLLTITWIMRLTVPFFSIAEHPFSGKDLILLIGGLFLIGKSTHEINSQMEGIEHGAPGGRQHPKMSSAILQIVVLDLIFSLDSVITAVGMAQQISVMVLAVMAAIGIMMVFSGAISAFISKHPSIKMLALSFLVLIGTMLVAEGFGKHVDKGYIYFAMAFSLLVEALNIRTRAKAQRSQAN